MQDNYEKLLSKAKPFKIPEGLFDSVLMGIHHEKRVQALKKRVVLFSFGVIISFFALVPIFSSLRDGVAQSGTLYFLSLLFSDPGVVLGLWQDFAFSLLETIPVVSIAAFLAVIFVFLGSMRLFIRDAAALFMGPRIVQY